MVYRSSQRAGFRATAAVVLLMALAGCQSGAGSNDNAVAEADTTAPPPPQERVLQSELRAFCPRITVREGTAAFTTYASGGNGDASKAIYQASIVDTTRACTRADGTMTIKVVVAGRIVPGPMGKPGSISLPIRVVVTQAGNVLYSELRQHQVSVNDTGSATQFVFTDPAVTIPLPPDNQTRIFVGFDEGPEKSDG